jgi:hypothetical protein
MQSEDRFTSQKLSAEFAGLWTVWDREEKRMVGSGHTFEEAKQAAVDAGESSVILARAPSASFFGRARRWTQVVAVFISLVPSISGSMGSSGSLQSSTSPVSSSGDTNTAADEQIECSEGADTGEVNE